MSFSCARRGRKAECGERSAFGGVAAHGDRPVRAMVFTCETPSEVRVRQVTIHTMAPAATAGRRDPGPWFAGRPSPKTRGCG